MCEINSLAIQATLQYRHLSLSFSCQFICLFSILNGDITGYTRYITSITVYPSSFKLFAQSITGKAVIFIHAYRASFKYTKNN